LAVALVDVSPEGLGVWLAGPVAAGEEVQVTVGVGLRRVTVLAEVRWCAPGPDAAYRAGLRLRRPLTDRALAELAV
jgi:hypothetical protein